MTVVGTVARGPQTLRLTRSTALLEGPVWVASVGHEETIGAREFGRIGAIRVCDGEGIDSDPLRAAVSAIVEAFER